MDWPWLAWAGLPTVLSSTFVCYAGAMRHRDVTKLMAANKRRGGAAAEEADAQSVVLSARSALSLPLAGSLLLCTFYFLFSHLQLLVLLYMLAASFASLYFVLASPCGRVLHPLCPHRRQQQGVAGALATALLLAWLMTGHYVLNNVLGASLCVTMISFLRLPNLRIAALCLGSFILYDIFWVFFSASVFGSNVMVEVASESALNPVASIGQTLHLPLLRDSPPSLQLPLKLLFPYYSVGSLHDRLAYSMLGLGDMVIPGLFFSFLLSFDDFLKATISKPSSPPSLHTSSYSYFSTGLIGYAIGMCMALICTRFYSIAQPALLYLVPCIIGPVGMKAWRASPHLSQLWSGKFDSSSALLPFLPPALDPCSQENESDGQGEGGREGGRESEREGGRKRTFSLGVGVVGGQEGEEGKKGKKEGGREGGREGGKEGSMVLVPETESEKGMPPFALLV